MLSALALGVYDDCMKFGRCRKRKRHPKVPFSAEVQARIHTCPRSKRGTDRSTP